MLIFVLIGVFLALVVICLALYKFVPAIQNIVNPLVGKLKGVDYKPIIEAAKKYDLPNKIKNFVSFYVNKK